MIILKCYLSYCSNVSPHSCSSLENLASLACRCSLETAASLSRRFLETSASLFRCSLESAASLSWTQFSQFWRFRFCWSSCHCCCCWMSRSRSCCCCRSCRPIIFPFRLHHSPESPHVCQSLLHLKIFPFAISEPPARFPYPTNFSLVSNCASQHLAKKKIPESSEIPPANFQLMPGTAYFDEHPENFILFSIGSRIGTPSGNRSSRTLFHSVSLAWPDRKSLDMNTRMRLMHSTVDNKTERTRGKPFWPERWGCTPLGVGVTLDRSLSLEMALPESRMRSSGEHRRHIARVEGAPQGLVQIYSAMRHINQVWCEGAEKTKLGRKAFLKVNHNFPTKVKFLILHIDQTAGFQKRKRMRWMCDDFTEIRNHLVELLSVHSIAIRVLHLE